MVFKAGVLAVVAATLLQGAVAWNVDLPPCLSPYQPFVYAGCFQDSSSEALLYRSQANTQNMTVEKCTAECKGNGFRYAGLEYYGVCFCGDTVNGPELPESSCTFPCTGDSSETCGGNNILSVWQDPTFPDASDVTTASYVSIGCYTDDSSEGRALPWSADVDTSTFTTEKCLAACEARGFPFAGTEYSNQCWCGSVLANYTSSVDPSECNMACTGDASEICGGSSLLSVYVAKELESLEPCGYQSSSSVSTSTAPCTTSTTSTTASTSTTSPVTTSTTTTVSSSTSSTSSSTAPCTTSTTTTVSSSTSSTSSSTAPCTTTSKPATTTLTTMTTTTASVCTATVTVPPTCDWTCGNWCLPGLPDWNDQAGCETTANICQTAIASCWIYAGWPGAAKCFEVIELCAGISSYCSSDCAGSPNQCSKGGCWGKHGWGNGGSPGHVTTTTFPCPATTTHLAPPPATTTKPATTTSCAPKPSNICTQPSDPKYGFGPGKPVGGIDLPIVCCNDDYFDWTNNPFKLYTSTDSSQCPSYPGNGCGSACAKACEVQYQSCLDVYVKACNSNSKKRWGSGGNHGSWGQGTSGSQAQQLCQVQYKECLAVNQNVNPGQACSHWGGNGW